MYIFKVRICIKKRTTISPYEHIFLLITEIFVEFYKGWYFDMCVNNNRSNNKYCPCIYCELQFFPKDISMTIDWPGLENYSFIRPWLPVLFIAPLKNFKLFSYFIYIKSEKNLSLWQPRGKNIDSVFMSLSRRKNKEGWRLFYILPLHFFVV